jgi:hypothetical protein
MKDKEKIEQLNQHYIDLREKTPIDKRDGEECTAFHDWYDAAYVFFSKHTELHDTHDYMKFCNIDNTGNCFILADKYDSIRAPYKALMSRIEEQCSPLGAVPIIKSQPNLWPFTTHDNHKRVFISSLVST